MKPGKQPFTRVFINSLLIVCYDFVNVARVKPSRFLNILERPATAYNTAKSRLEKKYGGQRKALTLRLEEVYAFKEMKEGN